MLARRHVQYTPTTHTECVRVRRPTHKTRSAVKVNIRIRQAQGIDRALALGRRELKGSAKLGGSSLHTHTRSPGCSFSSHATGNLIAEPEIYEGHVIRRKRERDGKRLYHRISVGWVGCIFCMTHGYMCFVYSDLYGSKTRNCSIILVSVSVTP